MKVLKLAVVLVILSLVWGCASKYMTSGKVYMQLQEYDKAIAQFKEEIKANPNNASAYVWLGRAYVATKQFEEACESFDKAMEISPTLMDKDFKKQPYYYWAIYFNAGASYMKMKDWEMARKRLVQAATLEPDTVTTYISLAWVYRNLNQRDSVIASYRKVIELAPQNIHARVDLARYYMDEQNYKDAIPVLQKTVELDSTNSDAFYLLGVCYSFEAKDTTEDVKNEYYARALRCFKKATDIDPQNEDAYFNWGTLLYKQKKYEEAIEPFKKAVEIAPDDKEAVTFLGASYLMSKHYEEAVEAYTRAIAIDPVDAENYINRASAYRGLKQRKKMDFDIKRAEIISTGETVRPVEKVVKVLVKGDTDLPFKGYIGTMEGAHSLEGKVPSEYDLTLKHKYDIAAVFVQKQQASGTLTVELIVNGEIVKTLTTTGIVAITWP